MEKVLRFRDLAERGIVMIRTTLARWIKDYGFPARKLIGPNTRV